MFVWNRWRIFSRSFLVFAAANKGAYARTSEIVAVKLIRLGGSPNDLPPQLVPALIRVS
jgi:hypothetical protein